jgi:capsule polysaccharide export protein KpsE/RkpR
MKTRAELIAMTDQELETYEQSLLAQWTPRMALENQIDRLSTELKGQLEIFNRLRTPDAPQNSRLKTSIQSLERRIENLIQNK